MELQAYKEVVGECNQLVGIRVRPLIQREIDHNLPVLWEGAEKEIRAVNSTHAYGFDRIIGPNHQNETVYQHMAKHIVKDAIDGINGTLFAYGQTSSGKTFTMFGDRSQKGTVNYAVEDLFSLMQVRSDRRFLARFSHIEIYNEEVRDLISNDSKQSNLKIREQDGEVFLEGITEVLLESPSHMFKLMSVGDQRRHVGATNMNEQSSRSHAIAKIIIESVSADEDDGSHGVLVSHLNFVDLAGSEKVGQTGASGTRLKEGSHINTSLFALANCVNKLSEKSSHIPYRDSKLTRLLQNSLGGNARTAIVCCITPACLEETLSTLRFAGRAKSISSKPTVNEVLDDKTMIRRKEQRIKKLEAQLASLGNLSSAAVEDTEVIQGMQSEIKNLRKLLFGQRTVIVPDRQISKKERRMTWFGSSVKTPFQLEGHHQIETMFSSEMETQNQEEPWDKQAAIRRPKPPGNAGRRRRPSAMFSHNSLSIPEQEEFDTQVAAKKARLDSGSKTSTPTQPVLTGTSLETLTRPKSLDKVTQTVDSESSIHPAGITIESQTECIMHDVETQSEMVELITCDRDVQTDEEFVEVKMMITAESQTEGKICEEIEKLLINAECAEIQVAELTNQVKEKDQIIEKKDEIVEKQHEENCQLQLQLTAVSQELVELKEFTKAEKDIQTPTILREKRLKRQIEDLKESNEGTIEYLEVELTRYKNETTSLRSELTLLREKLADYESDDSVKTAPSTPALTDTSRKPRVCTPAPLSFIKSGRSVMKPAPRTLIQSAIKNANISVSAPFICSNLVKRSPTTPRADYGNLSSEELPSLDFGSDFDSPFVKSDDSQHDESKLGGSDPICLIDFNSPRNRNQRISDADPSTAPLPTPILPINSSNTSLIVGVGNYVCKTCTSRSTAEQGVNTDISGAVSLEDQSTNTSTASWAEASMNTSVLPSHDIAINTSVIESQCVGCNTSMIQSSTHDSGMNTSPIRIPKPLAVDQSVQMTPLPELLKTPAENIKDELAAPDTRVYVENDESSLKFSTLKPIPTMNQTPLRPLRTMRQTPLKPLLTAMTTDRKKLSDKTFMRELDDTILGVVRTANLQAQSNDWEEMQGSVGDIKEAILVLQEVINQQNLEKEQDMKEKEQLESMIENLTVKLENKEQEFAEILNEALEDRNELSAGNDMIRDKLNEQINQADELKSKLETMSEDLNIKSGQLTTAQQEISSLTAQLEKAESERDEIISEKKKLVNPNELEKVQIKLHEKDEELHRKHTEINSLNSVIQTKTEEFDKKCDEFVLLQEQISNLNSVIHTKTEEFDKKCDEVVSLQEQVDGLQTDIAEKNKQLNMNTEQLANKQQQINSLNSVIQTKTEKFDKKRDEVVSLQEQVDGLQSDIAEKNKQLNMNTEQLANKQQQINNLNSVIHTKTEEFDKKRDEVVSLQEQLGDVKRLEITEKVESVKEELKICKDDLRRVKIWRDQDRRENKQLKLKIDNYKKREENPSIVIESHKRAKEMAEEVSNKCDHELRQLYDSLTKFGNEYFGADEEWDTWTPLEQELRKLLPETLKELNKPMTITFPQSKNYIWIDEPETEKGIIGPLERNKYCRALRALQADKVHLELELLKAEKAQKQQQKECDKYAHDYEKLGLKYDRLSSKLKLTTDLLNKTEEELQSRRDDSKTDSINLPSDQLLIKLKIKEKDNEIYSLQQRMRSLEENNKTLTEKYHSVKISLKNLDDKHTQLGNKYLNLKQAGNVPPLTISQRKHPDSPAPLSPVINERRTSASATTSHTTSHTPVRSVQIDELDEDGDINCTTS